MSISHRGTEAQRPESKRFSLDCAERSSAFRPAAELCSAQSTACLRGSEHLEAEVGVLRRTYCHSESRSDRDEESAFGLRLPRAEHAGFYATLARSQVRHARRACARSDNRGRNEEIWLHRAAALGVALGWGAGAAVAQGVLASVSNWSASPREGKFLENQGGLQLWPLRDGEHRLPEGCFR